MTRARIRTVVTAGWQPVDWTWLSQWVGHRFLPAWFAVWGLQSLIFLAATPGTFGFDVYLYQLAGHAWVTGHSPWDPSMILGSEPEPFTYAGPPVTLLPFILLDWVPASVLALVVVLGAATTTMWVLRRLGRPVWWMLFPPIIEGIWVGNLNMFVIALLVWGGTVTGAIAILLKVYAALPLLMLDRWRAAVLAGVVVVLTSPFLPWLLFLEDYSSITAALADQAWGGRTNVLTTPLATAGGLIALVLLGRERAAWLIVPVVWPATQLHYTVLALPALSPFLAMAGAITAPGFVAGGVMALALWERRATVVSILRRRSPEPAPGGRWLSPTSISRGPGPGTGVDDGH
jgi:hypothetical protein